MVWHVAYDVSRCGPSVCPSLTSWGSIKMTASIIHRGKRLQLSDTKDTVENLSDRLHNLPLNCFKCNWLFTCKTAVPASMGMHILRQYYWMGVRFRKAYSPVHSVTKELWTLRLLYRVHNRRKPKNRPPNAPCYIFCAQFLPRQFQPQYLNPNTSDRCSNQNWQTSLQKELNQWHFF